MACFQSSLIKLKVPMRICVVLSDSSCACGESLLDNIWPAFGYIRETAVTLLLAISRNSSLQHAFIHFAYTTESCTQYIQLLPDKSCVFLLLFYPKACFPSWLPSHATFPSLLHPLFFSPASQLNLKLWIFSAVIAVRLFYAATTTFEKKNAVLSPSCYCNCYLV